MHEHSIADRVPPALHTPSRLPRGPELRGSRQHDAKELPTDTLTNIVNKGNRRIRHRNAVEPSAPHAAVPHQTESKNPPEYSLEFLA